MTQKRNLLIGGVIVAAIALLWMGQTSLESAAQTSAVEAPMFEVDPLWPKPLPNHWILGSAIGVGVDSRDHVFIVHRGNGDRRDMGAAQDPPEAECCYPAPPVLEFDPEGNLVNAWGGPSDDYDWPSSNHGITVDPMDNLWIGGNGGGDSQILKFSRDGEFIMQLGDAGMEVNSNQTDHFGRVAKLSFDATGEETFVAASSTATRLLP